MRVMKQSVDDYCVLDSSSTVQPRHVILCGGPGCGKTYSMQKAVVCCAARGLNVFVSAEKAERAQEFGSFHLARLFQLHRDQRKLPSRRWDNCSLMRLSKYPKHLFLLRTLDVTFIDEIGTVSAKMLSVIDIILRHVRKRNDMFGGVLVINTVDPDQLSCIDGYPFLTASQIMTTFEAVRLSRSIRHQNDA